jgi:mRNA interferase MazF
VLEQGEIVLIPIPFIDLSSQKRRPVVVVTKSDYHLETLDMLVVAMTSNPAKVDYGFKIDTIDLERGKLNHPGFIRVDRIYTMSQSLIVTKFGKVNEVTLERIRSILADLVAKKRLR